MTYKSTKIIVALAAALTLAVAVGLASANRLSYSHQSFRIMWSGLSFSEVGGGFPITCAVTLEGRFHSATMAKVNGALVALITRAVVDNAGCAEGHATILEETLPWHVTYQSFSGRLPAISRVRHALIGAGFQIEAGGGLRCLAQTTTTFPAAGEATREARGNIITLSADSTLAIPITGGACPLFGIFNGEGEVFAQGSTRVSLNLI